MAGAPAIAAATAVGVHGVAVGANAGSNLLADTREMSAGKGSGGSSKSSEPSGGKSDSSGTSSGDGTGNDAYGGYYDRKQQRTNDYNDKTGSWTPAEKTSPPNGPYRTDKEADVAAEMLGYKRVPEKSHGRAVYTNGKDYISPDTPRKTTGSTDNGGVWKKAGSPGDLLSKDTRLGTYDKNLNRKGD